jgi:Enoyl-(Acyl carrier protein) reductase
VHVVVDEAHHLHEGIDRRRADETPAAALEVLRERAVPHYNVMGVAKATLDSSVQYLAWDLGGKNIRVNAISAGPVRTLAAQSIAGFPTMEAIVEERAPLHRPIDADDVGAAARYLLSTRRGRLGDALDFATESGGRAVRQGMRSAAAATTAKVNAAKSRLRIITCVPDVQRHNRAWACCVGVRGTPTRFVGDRHFTGDRLPRR